MGIPKITVLMAMYNGGEYLKQSVKSILDQTYKDFEFLIINDCSTDRSLEVIESFNDDRIKVHNNFLNEGQTRSLNIGLRLAKGDHVARIDADDIALPNWLSEQMNFIQKNSNYSIVSTYVVAVDEKNKIKKVYKPPVSGKDLVLRSLIASPINHVGAVLLKRDITDHGSYDERYKTAADYDLWGKLLRDDLKITTIPKILMAIREHGGSLSRSERGKYEIEEIKEIVRKNIDQFSSVQFSSGDINLFCRVNYDAGNLTDVEFNEALNVTRNVYGHLAPSLKFESQKIDRWTKKRSKTLYLKRILSLIEKKDHCAARRLSFQAMKEFGLFSLFVLLWIASLFGGIILCFIPGLYNKILRQNARLQLAAQLNINLFN